VEWARERNIRTLSEMIYGFPYESPRTFFDGIERLVREGVNDVVILPLQLFPGIDLAGKSARENYAIETRFRLAPNGYGIYDDGKLTSVETEEVVLSNRWSSEDDYFTVRRYGFFQMAILGRGYFYDFFRLCAETGVPVDGVVRHLSLVDYSLYPALGAILAEHRRDASAELKASQDDVYRDVVDQLRHGKEVGGVRVNLVYLGKMMSSPRAVRELLEIVRDHFEALLENHPHRDVVLAYLREVLPNRIVVLNRQAKDRIRFKTHFDFPKWLTGAYRDASEVMLREPRVFEATISQELKSNLATFDAGDRSDLQGIFDKTSRKHLLRSVAPSASSEADVEDDLIQVDARPIPTETRAAIQARLDS
jgi:hypothetical protein